MKKTIINFMKITFIAVLFFGCEEDFLVEEPTGNVVNLRQITEAGEVNPEIPGGGVTGIYGTMFTTGTGGTGSQQDMGQKGYDIYGDMVCGDMALSTSTYGWYRARIHELQAMTDFTQQENYQVWRYYFRVINRSNLVIESILQQPQPETEEALMAAIDDLDQENKYNIAQAFAMRAHSYFNLTQYMINDVTASWTSPTLPIYTEFDFPGKPKSTTEEIYQLMEDDMTRAIDLLQGYNRPSKVQINRPVAQTIYAYILASRKDRWDDVVTLTNNALAETEASLMLPDDTVDGILGGFNNVESNGWMWGIDINEDIGLGLVSWWGQIDLFSYSYAAVGDNKAMDIDLYNSMRVDDIRRVQFLDNPASARHLQPWRKFFDSDRVVFGTSQIVKADYIYMRYAEPLLLNIEARAKSGDEGGARTALLDFAAQRISDPSYISGLSGQDLLDEIYLQQRWELWGEGKSYYAFKRNEATVTRGSNHLSFGGQSFSWNDEDVTFEIPLQEIQDNNNINSQN